MAVALKEKAPTDPAELKKWREDEQAKERAKRDKEKAEIGTLWSRRDFLGVLGWSGFGVFSLIGLLAAVRSAFPRVLFLPPSKFKAGLPDDYVVGEVSEKFKQDFRTWIIRAKARATTSADSTSKGRRRGRWIDSRLRSATTVSWWSTSR